ncbi:formate dehydrogenase accessory sulfurtransferase FdhD [Roseiarcaceae bacterium H3SJ34-1]|uniref:formate dehydrogenase accessory sulfurtransferase FdhD n=1 Tax=Terripilifer ovatus TaxID=3032367 RepID=UPI003AB99B17|nr:formate dehydrogenase accessory sulfurtransferase FdhD [Roseiarcaceae bacterium H3SJ34-1]
MSRTSATDVFKADPGRRAASVRYEAERLRFADGTRQRAPRDVPVETPMTIVYAPVPFAVMVASPQDLEDFATGFSFTEGIIDSIDDIRSVAIEEDEAGLKLVVTLASDKLQRHLARGRNLAGRTGCGVCGIDDLNALPRAAMVPGMSVDLRIGAIRRSLAQLPERQKLNAATGAVHAAAWCGLDGRIDAIREDVGRHNALDKLVGHLLRQRTDPLSGFLAITSRCSFEMVEKAAAFGARALVAISAPTSLAVERARSYGITLIALARSDGALVFNGGEHVLAGDGGA